MSTLLKQSTQVTLSIGPFLDDTDGKTLETALTINQADIKLSKNGGAFAAKNAANGATADGATGWYTLTVNGTDTNTCGILRVYVAVAGALPVWHEFQVVCAEVYDTLAGTDNFTVDLTASLAGNIATIYDRVASTGAEISVSTAAKAAIAEAVWKAGMGTLFNYGDGWIGYYLASAVSAEDPVSLAYLLSNIQTIQSSTSEISGKIGVPISTLAADIAAISTNLLAAVESGNSPDSAVVSTGTPAGTISNVASRDDVSYSITEISGAAGGLDVTVTLSASNVSNIPTRALISGYYAGSASHNIGIYAWNYVTNAWDLKGTMLTRSNPFDYEIPLTVENHDSITGEMKLRFLHNTLATYISNHVLYLDYIIFNKVASNSGLYQALAEIASRLPADLNNGRMSASLDSILGTILTEAVAGQIAGAFKKLFNVANPTGTVNALPDVAPGQTGGLATHDTANAIKAKTDNLPADPASNTQVNTRLAADAYTAPDNAMISAAKTAAEAAQTAAEAALAAIEAGGGTGGGTIDMTAIYAARDAALAAQTAASACLKAADYTAPNNAGINQAISIIQDVADDMLKASQYVAPNNTGITEAITHAEAAQAAAEDARFAADQALKAADYDAPDNAGIEAARVAAVAAQSNASQALIAANQALKASQYVAPNNAAILEAKAAALDAKASADGALRTSAYVAPDNTNIVAARNAALQAIAAADLALKASQYVAPNNAAIEGMVTVLDDTHTLAEETLKLVQYTPPDNESIVDAKEAAEAALKTTDYVAPDNDGIDLILEKVNKLPAGEYVPYTGFVKTVAGVPIPGANVYLCNSANLTEEPISNDVSNAAGKFTVYAPSAGTYYLQIEAVGKERKAYQVEIS